MTTSAIRATRVVLAVAPVLLVACGATSANRVDDGQPGQGVDAGTTDATAGNRGEAEAGVEAGVEDAGTDGASSGDGSSGDGSSGPTDAGRDPSLQPFSSTGVWNLPVGSGATWGTSSDADVDQLQHTSAEILAIEYGKPFYVGTTSDPLVTLQTRDTFYPVASQQLRIPSTASFTRWMDMFDRTQPRYFWSSYDCSFLGDAGVAGGVTCAYTAVADVCGDGVSNLHGANRYDWGIGTIRHWELAAGVIRHTLRFAVSQDVAKSAGSTWTEDVPWPDDNEDYSGPSAYSGKLIFGSTIGIPAGVDLTTLGLSSGGLTLARALQDHGAIMRDTTGESGALAFYAEPQDEDDPVIEQMRTDLPKLVKKLSVMRNQGADNVNGGGTPRAALVPAIDASVCTP